MSFWFPTLTIEFSLVKESSPWTVGDDQSLGGSWSCIRHAVFGVLCNQCVICSSRCLCCFICSIFCHVISRFSFYHILSLGPIVVCWHLCISASLVQIYGFTLFCVQRPNIEGHWYNFFYFFLVFVFVFVFVVYYWNWPPLSTTSMLLHYVRCVCTCASEL